MRGGDKGQECCFLATFLITKNVARAGAHTHAYTHPRIHTRIAQILKIQNKINLQFNIFYSNFGAEYSIVKMILHPKTEIMLQFVSGGIYHIYNAGCGGQPVFFQERNYPYFIKKMMTYICPYADIIAYDLRPHEIHILVHVKHLSLFVPERKRMRTLAESIGLMLRSYAQAINKQENRKGVLWQGPTKAEVYTVLGCSKEVIDDEKTGLEPPSTEFQSASVEHKAHKRATGRWTNTIRKVKQWFAKMSAAPYWGGEFWTCSMGMRLFAVSFELQLKLGHSNSS